MTEHPPSDITNQLTTFTDVLGGLRQAVDDERAARVEEAAVHEREIAAHERETAAHEREIDVLRLKYYTARRAIRLVIIFGIVGFLIICGVLIRQKQQADQRQQDRIDQLVASCLNSNATKQAIVQTFDVYTVTLGNISPSATPEDAANKQRLIEKLRTDFRAAVPPELASLDCNPKTITTPTTFPTTTQPG